MPSIVILSLALVKSFGWATMEIARMALMTMVPRLTILDNAGGPRHLTDSTPTEYRLSRYDVERVVMVAATGRAIADSPFGAERELDRDTSAVIEVRNLHKW